MFEICLKDNICTPACTPHTHTHTHTHTRNAMSAATDLKGRGAAGSIFGSFSLASSFCLPPKLSHPLQQCTAQPGMTAGQCADREVHSCGRMDWRKHGKCSRDVCEEQEHVCVYTHTHTMHAYMHTNTHAHTHVCTHTHANSNNLRTAKRTNLAADRRADFSL